MAILRQQLNARMKDRAETESGRVRLPRLNPCWRLGMVSVGLCLVCLPGITALGQSPNPQERPFARKPLGERRFPGIKRAAAARAMANGSDREAVVLLRQMLRPLTDYSANEETWIAMGGGTVSKQTIKGDTRGNIVRYYQSPPLLRGDLMLTGPNRYAYYRAATKSLTEVPPAGGAEDERDKRIVNGIRDRIFVAKRTGNETVAGINAIIVLVTPVNPSQQGYVKFWIDPATHIRLKVEIANAANAKVSDSELSNLLVGAAANVLPGDFQPARFGGGAARQVKRERVGSLQEAMARVTFHPLQPGTLPPGFRLDGVQVIEGPNRVGLFLRYTDGVSVFTLTEHRVRADQKAGAAANAIPLHWFVNVGNYDVDVVYRGHLPAAQEQMIHDSLQPAH